MKIVAGALFCLCLIGAARAQEGRWVTFETGHNSWGKVEHQIDRNSIRQEGPFKIFWMRIWSDKDHQPVVFNRNEALYFLSRKYAVDCPRRRFGSQYIDSNDPGETRHRASLQTVRWEKLDRVPAVGRLVCGER
jgi:hypothetical protein